MALLSVVLSLAVATACGISTARVPVTVAAPVELCRAGNLTGGDPDSGGAAAGTLSYELALYSKHACSLRGFLRVTLLNRAGGTVQTVPMYGGDGASDVTISPKRPASFYFYYENPTISVPNCQKRTYSARVGLPGTDTAVRIRFVHAPFVFCAGRIGMTPVTSGVTPSQA